MASFPKVLLNPPARRTCGALRTCHPYDISCWRPHLKLFLNIWKRCRLWISDKIGEFVSRGSNFILSVVLLKTLQDKLKLYHWNFERMMDESCIIALKRLISKEEFFFWGREGMNKAFRFMTLYDRKERESVFWMLKSYHMVPFAGIIWHLTYGECHYFLSLRKVLKLSTLSPILNRSISKAVTGQFAMSSIPAPLLSKQIMA